jgi:hypothetical protein
MLVELSVESWRDPLVVNFYPSAAATDIPMGTQITVTWSKAMITGTEFVVNGPLGVISGTFSYDPATFTLLFTPLSPLETGTQYTVVVMGQIDSLGQVQQIPETWSFTTAGNLIRKMYLPVIRK